MYLLSTIPGKAGPSIRRMSHRGLPGSALALDIGGTKIRQALVSGDGQISECRTYNMVGRPPADCAALLGRAWKDQGPVLGLGVAIAGMVDAEGRVLAAPHLPHWEGTQLPHLLGRYVSCPVHVLFDGAASLLGEVWLNPKPFRHAFLLSIGTGIGGALLVDGHVLHGVHGLAGMPAGWLSSSGDSLEHLASGPAVARAAGCGSGIEAFQQRQRGDLRAMQAFERASDALYRAIAMVTATADVSTVLVSGGFGCGAFPYLFPLDHLPDPYRTYVLVHREVTIEGASTGDLSPLLGAARHAMLRA
jgi:predicted NBD/HSP70 family sugar kinase